MSFSTGIAVANISLGKPVDMEHALDALGGEKEIFFGMLAKVEKLSLNDTLRQIAKSVNDRDFLVMKNNAHSLKGASGYVGASYLHYCCYHIQEQFTLGNHEKMLFYYPFLIESAIEFKIYSRRLLTENEGETYQLLPEHEIVDLANGYRTVKENNQYYCLNKDQTVAQRKKIKDRTSLKPGTQNEYQESEPQDNEPAVVVQRQDQKSQPEQRKELQSNLEINTNTPTLQQQDNNQMNKKKQILMQESSRMDPQKLLRQKQINQYNQDYNMAQSQQQQYMQNQSNNEYIESSVKLETPKNQQRVDNRHGGSQNNLQQLMMNDQRQSKPNNGADQVTDRGSMGNNNRYMAAGNNDPYTTGNQNKPPSRQKFKFSKDSTERQRALAAQQIQSSKHCNTGEEKSVLDSCCKNQANCIIF